MKKEVLDGIYCWLERFLFTEYVYDWYEGKWCYVPEAVLESVRSLVATYMFDIYMEKVVTNVVKETMDRLKQAKRSEGRWKDENNREENFRTVFQRCGERPKDI